MKKIGIKLADGSFHPILDEGATEKVELSLTTVNDGQTVVKVDLYRSAESSMDDAEYVDTLELSNIKEHPNGEPNINLNLWFDQEGHLCAELVDKESGAESRTSVPMLSNEQPSEIENSLPVEDVNFDLGKTDDSVPVSASVFENEKFSIQADAPEEGDPADMARDNLPSFDDLDLDMIVDEGASGPTVAEESAVEESIVMDEPAVEESAVSEEPAVEEPAADETIVSDEMPSMDDLNLDMPMDEPPAEESAVEESIVMDEPAVEETTVSEEPAVEEPAADETIVNDEMPPMDDLNLDMPMDEPPAEETAVAEEPAVEEPAADEMIVNDEMPPMDDLNLDMPTDEPPAEESAVSEEPAVEEPAADETIVSGEMPSMDDLNLDMPMDEPPAEESAVTEEPTADEPAFEESIAMDDPQIEEPPVDEAPISTDLPTMDEMSFDLPDDTNATDMALPEKTALSNDLNFDLPDFDDTAIEQDDLAQDSALPDFDFSNTDFDMPDFGDTAIEQDDLAQDSALPDFDFSDTDFDMPDFGDTDTSSTKSAFASNLFDDESDSDPFADDGSNPFAESDTSSSAFDFSDLYDDNSEEGDTEDAPSRKGQKLPVVVCLLCAIICVVAVVLMFLMGWDKFNLFKNKSQENIVAEETSSTPATLEPIPVQQPVAPSAKEDEVVVIKQAETAVPEFPKEEPKAAPKEIKYKVKWGDTLWDLADSYYKNPWLYPKIAKYNNIKNPDYIIAGSYILIPE